MLKKIKDFILDLLFPKKCHTCGKEGAYLCKECFEKIPLIKQNKCPLCYNASSGGFLCFNCQKKTCLEKIFLASDWKNPILKESVHILKYECIKDLIQPLGHLLIDSLRNNWLSKIKNWKLEIRNFIIVPIPLHKSRLKERGFNQAELLAQIIGKELNLEVKNILQRKKFLIPQTDLKDRKKRRENIKGAFQYDKQKEYNPKRNEGLLDRNIILVDDIITTGATIQEAAKTLKKAGARRIWALALTRG